MASWDDVARIALDMPEATERQSRDMRQWRVKDWMQRSSPRHASRHARSMGHPIARSSEPGEDWSWCCVDQLAFVVTG